jgi:hypothetical protein
MEKNNQHMLGNISNDFNFVDNIHFSIFTKLNNLEIFKFNVIL